MGRNINAGNSDESIEINCSLLLLYVLSIYRHRAAWAREAGGRKEPARSTRSRYYVHPKAKQVKASVPVDS